MTVIALTSSKGSPGVTTTALALAWVWPEVAPARRVLVVDADVAGGDMTTGYLRGAVTSTDGLLGLAGDRSSDVGAALWGHLIALDDDGTRLLLTGINDPAQARSLVGTWPNLASVFAKLHDEDPAVDVIVDLGRLGSAHEATVLRQRADHVLLVMRSSLTSTASARSAVRRLAEERAAAHEDPLGLGCVLVGECQPYSRAEIADAVGAPVVATIAWDPTAADVFSTGSPAGWRFGRSPLLRSVRAAAAALGTAATPTHVPPAQREPVPAAGGAHGRGVAT
ncbi:MAG: hypothetical protein MUE31_00285 [Candidatus Nanopelagicales bacterium]|jgi:hypothetical protein|nr:hypothetical protein [Candidatus Nanopelagicales bacterium]